MSRKKKSVRAPRTRRSPYERSLDYATKRLDKAITERQGCALRLADLDREIPYLQTVIRALTPPTQIIVASHRGGNIFVPPPTVPEHLKPFFAANVDELPGEEDAFLNVTIPGEKEVLP